MIRIDHAVCVQLNRLVTIDEARGAFGVQRDLERFAFYFAELACAAHRVRIAGVNYRLDAATGRKFVENHFRPLDEHRPDCPYGDIDRYDASDVHKNSGAHRTHALASESGASTQPCTFSGCWTRQRMALPTQSRSHANPRW